MTDLFLPCSDLATLGAVRAEQAGLRLAVCCCESVFDNEAYEPPCQDGCEKCPQNITGL